MTTAVSICYSTDDSYYPILTDWTDTLSDTLNAWKSAGVPGTHPTNTGGFFTGGVNTTMTFTGDTYAFTTGSGYAFSVTGSSLTYDFPTHTLGGYVGSISFGGGLDTDGTVLNPFLTVCFDPELYSTGNTGIVHEVIYGLMSANVTPLLNLLVSLGVDTTTTSIAALDESSPYGVDCGCDSELVGVPEADDFLLAA